MLIFDRPSFQVTPEGRLALIDFGLCAKVPLPDTRTLTLAIVHVMQGIILNDLVMGFVSCRWRLWSRMITCYVNLFQQILHLLSIAKHFFCFHILLCLCQMAHYKCYFFNNSIHNWKVCSKSVVKIHLVQSSDPRASLSRVSSYSVEGRTVSS